MSGKALEIACETKIMVKLARLSSWDVIYALNMVVACAISYWVMIQSLISIISKDSDLLGGMRAAATVFVFRTTAKIARRRARRY